MPESFEDQNQEQEKGELTFRDLRLEDCDDMVEVVNSIVEEGAPIRRKQKTTKEDWLPILQKILERVEKGKDICVAAEKDGHIVGWLAGGLLEEGDDNMPTAEVFTAILSEKGRAGLKNFIDLARAWLKRAKKEWGIKKVITETSDKNRAKNLYIRMLGFVEKGPSKTKGYVMLEKVLEDDEGIDIAGGLD